MNKVAIAFSTKDRVELSRQSIEPLLQPDNFDLFWVDGSNTDEGKFCPFEVYEHRPIGKTKVRSNVRGGADAAIVYSLTEMLNDPAEYTHVGLVENDVLLHKDWFGPTMALFARGEADGLGVGAVSARAYEDRILFQRDGYSVMHNLGAGMAIFTRAAAELVLQYFRTGYTLENRRAFASMSGKDVGNWWAFRASEHWLCADWQFDKVLTQHGLSSLALTPSCVEMIGQEPPLEDQGLRLAKEPVELLRDDKGFAVYAKKMEAVRNGTIVIPHAQFYRGDDGSHLYFPHQFNHIGGVWYGNWNLKWSQGFGPFSFRAGDPEEKEWEENNVRAKTLGYPQLRVPVSGTCAILATGGPNGGRIEIMDAHSGFVTNPELGAEKEHAQPMQLVVPGGVGTREIIVTARSPGVTIYGLIAKDEQAYIPAIKFNHSMLPPAG